MAGDEHDRQGGAGTKQAEREARLAAQLRANLQRRKQQARGRAPEPPPEAAASGNKGEPSAGEGNP